MITFKRITFTLASLAICTLVSAQSSSISLNNTTSPFTRYGVGTLSDMGFGGSRSMGGTGFALRDGRQINVLNPASYSNVDSLTFLFDTGFSMEISRYSQPGASKTASNASFDYVAMQFRLRPGLGFTAGLKPFSHVGYNLGYKQDIENTENDKNSTHSYYGTGGFSEVFAGLGYAPIKNLSLGFNISYLYGNISRTSLTTSDMTSESRQNGEMNVYDYKLDFGAQYHFLLNPSKPKEITVGAVYSLGHKLNTSDSHRINSAITDIDANLKIPHSFGAGISYRENSWMIEGNYSLQLWKQDYTDPISYSTPYATHSLLNRSRYSAGAEYLPNLYSRKYSEQIRYRFGAWYTTPYYKILNPEQRWVNGATEFGVSAGFGLPVPVLLNRSLINVSFQYVRTSAKDLLTDNSFRISVGLTFNETWFKKWRVE